MTETSPMDALKILNEARKAVPAVKYALAVAGIAAAAALVSAFVGQGRAALLLIGLVFVGMFLVFLFSTLVASKSTSVKIAGIVLLWAVLLFFITFLAFTVSAFLINYPSTWVRFLDIEAIDPQEERIKRANRLVERYIASNPLATEKGTKVFTSPQRNERFIDGCIVSPLFPTQFGQQCREEAQKIIATMYCRSMNYRESMNHVAKVHSSIHSSYVLELAEAPNDSLDIKWQTSETSGFIFTEIECH